MLIRTRQREFRFLFSSPFVGIIIIMWLCLLGSTVRIGLDTQTSNFIFFPSFFSINIVILEIVDPYIDTQ